MGDFKNEYRRAVDRLEPDGRLIESLKADMKAAAAPPKVNFFVRYGWVFGSAAACLAVVLAVSVFFALGSREEMSGGAALNGDAYDNADKMTENASYNANENAGEADGEWVMQGPGEAGGSYIATDYNGADNTQEDKDGSYPTADERYETADCPMPFFEPQQIEALKPLSYEELKALVMIDRSETNLIFTDFSLYNYMEVLKDDVYYLVLRYDRDGLTLPVVAAFPGEPVDTVISEIVSLKICLKHDEADSYMDLRKISMEDFEYYFSPSEYMYDFGEGYMYFGEKDLDRLTPMTDEEFVELMNKAERGSLCLHDFAELERFGVGVSYYTQTLVCAYTDGETGQGYALIAHFQIGNEDAVPDRLILRRRDSIKEVDLLNDYDMLGRFLAG